MSVKKWDLLRLTLLSLRSNLLRSGLTMVGVFMGVAAVMGTLQVRTISQQVIAKQLSQQEAPQALLFSWTLDFQHEDLEYLRSRMRDEVKAIAGISWNISNAVRFQDIERENLDSKAVTRKFLEASGRKLLQGRFFTKTDIEKYRPVIVIDQKLAAELFPNDNPVGKRIFFGQRPYFIIGVVETKNSLFSRNQSEGLLLVSTVYYEAMTAQRQIDRIAIRPYHRQNLEKVNQRAEQLLKQRFPHEKFRGFNNIRRIQRQEETLTMVSRSLLAVGVVSLLVGGVGIANITIATVTERTPEIGLRMAIGATQKDIMLQFILEATLLSLLGGILAIATIHSITIIVAQTFTLPYTFSTFNAAIAIGSSIFVGVGASFFPALQASKLDPVAALRGN
ncbi:ABC transporter permease [Geitlerinema sp. PCC 9228]|jgi:putative ABC transport system permease protein|uniref:ABC transporter permease n=1 Tax=Geitlerinema sp. PCC 9228 TaxID=111611 RepID=UPI0008F99D05|nr:ABC transporter permease [Geitlerinema sp. PCC 9228]